MAFAILTTASIVCLVISGVMMLMGAELAAVCFAVAAVVWAVWTMTYDTNKNHNELLKALDKDAT